MGLFRVQWLHGTVRIDYDIFVAFQIIDFDLLQVCVRVGFGNTRSIIDSTPIVDNVCV